MRLFLFSIHFFINCTANCQKKAKCTFHEKNGICVRYASDKPGFLNFDPVFIKDLMNINNYYPYVNTKKADYEIFFWGIDTTKWPNTYVLNFGVYASAYRDKDWRYNLFWYSCYKYFEVEMNEKKKFRVKKFWEGVSCDQ